MVSYKTLPYNEDNLADSLSSNISAENVMERPHFHYLQRYLSDSVGVGAKTILVEEEYVSKAYLTDYSNYYATCFHHHERYCKRVHFFNVNLDIEKFESELLDLDSKVLNEAYLGYIVVKPLPDSVMGPTLLCTYAKRKDSAKRFFPACRTYKVNLFGREFLVESLAYQEQDTVVSACASVAVWSCFHKTSKLFNTSLPSPGEITKLAGNLFINYGRTYPNPGLDLTQVCRAIDAVGLVSEVRSSAKFDEDINLAKRIIYGYLKAGIPILLLTKSNSENRVGHAVTIVGYCEPNLNTATPPIPSISLLADKIDRFYIHDDQIGPFARYSFSGNTALSTTTWNGTEEIQTSAWIHAAIIPLYPKIRVKFEDVFETVSRLDQIFFVIDMFRYEMEWDIFLTESNVYKSEILASSLKSESKKKKIMSHYPRYVWVARAQVGGIFLFDLVFDSTDFPSSRFCLDFILYDRSITTILAGALQSYKELIVNAKEGPQLGEYVFKKMLEEFQI